MKRFFGTVLICGFLAASLAQAAKPAGHLSAHRKQVVKKHSKVMKRHNAKARKVAKVRRANARKSA